MPKLFEPISSSYKANKLLMGAKGSKKASMYPVINLIGGLYIPLISRVFGLYCKLRTKFFSIDLEKNEDL